MTVTIVVVPRIGYLVDLGSYQMYCISAAYYKELAV